MAVHVGEGSCMVGVQKDVNGVSDVDVPATSIRKLCKWGLQQCSNDMWLVHEVI